MDKLFSPWRSKYIESFNPDSKKNNGCIFCRMAEENKDKENFLLHRSKHSYIIMNLYPYNSGHLLIVPYKHTGELIMLNDDETLDCMNTLNLGCKILKKSLYPDGFNIGSNIGKISGAGIEDHVHFHIVPRWNGDTNFMPVLNDVKVVSEAMEMTYEKLLAAIKKVEVRS